MDPEGLRGAAAYYDAQVELAERLCVEIALAARGAGATILTHASDERLDVRGGAVVGVEIVDEQTGERHRAPTSMVLNTAGPWVDEVLVGLEGGTRLIGGTKDRTSSSTRSRGLPPTPCTTRLGPTGGR